MAAETGLQIDGKFYETPDISSFSLDECQVLYDYSGLVIEDFVPLEGESEEDHLERIDRMFRNPGLKKTLLHVAYQRGNTKVPVAKVRQLVGAANWLDPFVSMEEEAGEGDDGPPESTRAPENRSSSGPLSNDNSPEPTNEKPGTGSPTGGDALEDTLVSTGALRSDTSPTSPHATWAESSL